MRSVRSVDEPGDVCPGDGSVRDADAGVGCGHEGRRLEVDSRGVDDLPGYLALGVGVREVRDAVRVQAVRER